MATTLQVRRPPFRIDETVPFQWQPNNPSFGLITNVFTFLAIAFERYIVSGTRRAMDRITDPDVRHEAEAFLRQEATFTPLFKMIFDNRGPLFAGGDERAGALFLWHFVEEIEHRSSALAIHHHVTPDRWYRIRKAPKVFAHVDKVFKLVLAGIEEHVPLEDRGLPTSAVGSAGLWFGELGSRLRLLRGRSTRPAMLAHVPGSELRTMIRHLLRSQTPGHDPAREPLPAWVDDWHAAFDRGDDVTTYAGAHL